MLYHLTDVLERIYSGFNLFDYLTVRAILGVLTALVVSLVFGLTIVKVSQTPIALTPQATPAEGN